MNNKLIVNFESIQKDGMDTGLDTGMDAQPLPSSSARGTRTRSEASGDHAPGDLRIIPHHMAE